MTSYRYTLTNGDSGTYRTDAKDRMTASIELERVYGAGNVENVLELAEVKPHGRRKAD